MNLGATATRQGLRSAARWARRLSLTLLGLAAGLVVAEVAYRLYMRSNGHAFDASKARVAFQLALSQSREMVPRIESAKSAQNVEERTQTTVLHPYLGFEELRGLDVVAAELARIGRPERPGEYEILIVGGSVASMFTQLGVPRLTEILSADPRLGGKRPVFLDHARGAWKQPQQAILVEYMLALGFEPDAVIDIDGFNEVALTSANAANGTHPIYPMITAWGALASGGVTDREAIDIVAEARARQKEVVEIANGALAWHFDASYLLSQLTLRRLHARLADAQRLFDGYTRRVRAISSEVLLHGPPFDAEPEAVVKCGVRAWREGSRSIDAACRRRGIHYVHVLQPNALDVQGRPLTAAERAAAAVDPWARGVHIGYPLLREAGAELRAEGERFVDATRIFDGEVEPPYFDRCHFGKRGNEILAEFIGAAFLGDLPEGR